MKYGQVQRQDAKSLRTGAEITVVAEVARLRSELWRVRLCQTVIDAPVLRRNQKEKSCEAVWTFLAFFAALRLCVEKVLDASRFHLKFFARHLPSGMCLTGAVVGAAISSFAAEETFPLLKAGYLPISVNQNIVAKMRAAGLNAVWAKVTSFKPDADDETSWRQIGQWADSCQTQGLQFWPVVNFAGGNNELAAYPEFRREVTLDGIVQQHTPCPVDEAYWRKVIFPRCVKLAEASRTSPSLAGVALDLEMYGADHAGYSAPCACAECRRGANSANAKALSDWQRTEVARIARQLQRQVQRFNPRFQFAAMHLEEPYPFHEGLALGLGTAEVPVVIAAERTYGVGYTPEVDETRERLRSLKAHVRYLGGLSLTHFNANQIAPELYALGTHGDGFWLYTLLSLAKPNEKISEVYRLPDPQEQYWPAFRSATSELDRFVATQGHHVSRLVAQRKPQEGRVTLSKRVLQPISFEKPKQPLLGEESHLHRYNIAFVQLTEGEVLRLRVTSVRTSKQMLDGEIKALDPEGKELLSRTLAIGATEDVELIAKSSGTHWLTLNMAQNSCRLSIANQHVSFFAGRHQRLKVHGHVRPLYFLVAEGQQAAVDVMTEDASDAVRVILRNPRGQVAAEQVVSGSQSVAVNGAPGLWSFTIEPAQGESFRGVQIGLAPPLAPYLADAPERLLRDKPNGR